MPRGVYKRKRKLEPKSKSNPEGIETTIELENPRKRKTKRRAKRKGRKGRKYNEIHVGHLREVSGRRYGPYRVRLPASSDSDSRQKVSPVSHQGQVNLATAKLLLKQVTILLDALV